LKIESENDDSLQHAQDVEKPLREWNDVKSDFYANSSLQMMIWRMNFRKDSFYALYKH
jgi:hypothetical protein